MTDWRLRARYLDTGMEGAHPMATADTRGIVITYAFNEELYPGLSITDAERLAANPRWADPHCAIISEFCSPLEISRLTFIRWLHRHELTRRANLQSAHLVGSSASIPHPS